MPPTRTATSFQRLSEAERAIRYLAGRYVLGEESVSVDSPVPDEAGQAVALSLLVETVWAESTRTPAGGMDPAMRDLFETLRVSVDNSWDIFDGSDATAAHGTVEELVLAMSGIERAPVAGSGDRPSLV